MNLKPPSARSTGAGRPCKKKSCMNQRCGRARPTGHFLVIIRRYWAGCTSGSEIGGQKLVLLAADEADKMAGIAGGLSSCIHRICCLLVQRSTGIVILYPYYRFNHPSHFLCFFSYVSSSIFFFGSPFLPVTIIVTCQGFALVVHHDSQFSPPQLAKHMAGKPQKKKREPKYNQTLW